MKKLLSALFLLALCSSLAMATVPDPAKCTIQGLLGPVGGAPNTKVALIAPGALNGTHLTITVRNTSNNVIPNASVQVVFNAQVLVCGNNQHSVQASALGVANVDLRGGGCLSGVSGACSIVSNGVELLNVVNVRSPDNASHTNSVPDLLVGISDLTFFADEFLNVAANGCHDYDNNGDVDIADLPYFGDSFVASLHCNP